MKKIVCAIALVLAMSMLLAGCDTAPQPEDTLQRFIEAYNKVDLNGMIDCLEPSIAQGYKALMNVASGLIGMTGVQLSISDLISAMPLLISISPEMSQSMQNMPKMSMEVLSKQINGSTATLIIRLTSVSNEGTESTEGSCTFVLQDGKWYIRNMQ